MRIVARYSFKNGLQEIQKACPKLLSEVEECIKNINPESMKTKKSLEKGKKQGKTLYSPIQLNTAFRKCLHKKGWKKLRIECDYSISRSCYIEGYNPRLKSKKLTAKWILLKNA